MPGENIYAWSITAANNGTADTSINFAEGQPRASVNNSARSMMAAHAKNRDLTNGSIVTGGSANAQTVTSGLTFTSVPTGMRILVKLGYTNTAAATLDIDGIGAVAIKTQTGADVTAGSLTVGRYAEFLYNGTNWILISTSTINIVVQLFTSSATYTPTAGMQYCIIECLGAGGGGGGSTGNSVGYYMAGGGGGAGGFSRKRATAAEIGASQAVTIGVGGAGGGYSTAAYGSAGGTSSVGSLVVAYGGSGGGPGGFGYGGGPPGPGGAVGIGDIAAGGNPGDPGEYRIAPGTTDYGRAGTGGAGCFGGAGLAATSASTSTVGGSATFYGSGGGGSSSANTGLGAGGGNGHHGIVIFTEFCT